MNWVLARLAEKTTWLGLFSLAASYGFTFSPDLQSAIVAVILAVVGLVGVLYKEKK